MTGGLRRPERLPKYALAEGGVGNRRSHALPPYQTTKTNGFRCFGRVCSASLAGSGQADASYYQPSYRSYAPNYAYRDYPAYNGYGYGTYRHGHGEIRELQRLFPETNWPPSMRYYSR